MLGLVMDKVTTIPNLRDTNTIIPSFSRYK
jgi:hypothetical protein